ncbi:hypothetical protein LCGC14_1295580 [marine sediment metagenome]|uniref:Uncharacterized protein n=1 Tax=marine sediment metagenome TaxID=412755 RepID=A0A0F9KRG2_9ZZZZ
MKVMLEDTKTMEDLADEVLAEIRARRDFDISAWAWDLAKQVAELND